MEAAIPKSVLTAPGYRVLALLYAALIVYGSLTPFHFQPVAWSETTHQLASLGRMVSRTDFLSNMLLTVPFGWLLSASLSVDRGWLTRLGAAPLAVGVCLVLCATIEFAQVYFPPRTPSAGDVIAQTLGGAIGAAAWLIGGQQTTQWIRRLIRSPRHGGWAVQLLPAYFLFIVLVQVMPLELSISPADLYRKYRDGQVQLVPSFPADFYAEMESQLWILCLYSPFGFLLALAGKKSPATWRAWLGVLGVGLAAGVFVELCQLLVAGSNTETVDALCGCLAIMAGFAVGTGLRAAAANPQTAQESPDRLAMRRLFESTGWRVALFSGWLLVLVYLYWQPFRFQLSNDVGQRAWSLIAVPFADYYTSAVFTSFDQLMKKTLLFVAGGALLSPCRAGWKTMIGVLLLGLLVAGILEAGQIFLPARYPSSSDLLLAAFGAWLGVYLGRWLHSAARATDSVTLEKA